MLPQISIVQLHSINNYITKLLEIIVDLVQDIEHLLCYSQESIHNIKQTESVISKIMM